VRTDDYGTTVVSEDMEQGIPRMWGGSTAEDDHCSVKGAGAKYFKNKIAVARRQKLPWEIDLLMKAQGQYSTQACTGVNVFSVGGYMGTIDNRGYPRAQMPMDSGYYLMGGFSFPAYFVPKKTELPFTHTKIYNNFKFLTFVEYAKGYKRSLKTAAEKSGSANPETTGLEDDVRRKSLASTGWGCTFAIPEQNLSMRFDMGWPLNHKLPKDGSHCHMWYRVTKVF
jgi:hemolysin activation/secretion protein